MNIDEFIAPAFCRSLALCLMVTGAGIFVPTTASAQGSQTNESQRINFETVLRLAGANNLDIRIAREKLAEARAAHDSAVLQFFPWISPAFTYRRHEDRIQDVVGNLLDADKQSYSVGGALVAQVDLGDALYKSLITRQLAVASAHGLAARRSDAIFLAGIQYFDLLRAQSAVEIAREAIRITSDYEQQLRNATSAGLAFKGDVLRVNVQVGRAQTILRQAEEQQRLASVRLAQTIRLDPVVTLEPVATEFVPFVLVATNLPLVSLLDQALAARPELKQSESQLTAARKNREAARFGPLVPAIGGQVFIGGLGGGRDNDLGNFGPTEDYAVTLGWRIGPGGLFDHGRRRTAEAQLRGIQLLSEKIRDELTQQVIESHTRVLSLADQIATTQQSIQAAEETFRLTRERTALGVVTVLENIQAEQELTRVRLEYSNAVAEFSKAQIGLSRAIGTLGN